MFLMYPGGGLAGLLILVATALFSWFFLRRFLVGTFTIGRDIQRQLPDNDSSADHVELLKRRYASGEITHEEYQKMREHLRD